MIDEMIRSFEYTVRFMERSVDDLSEQEMVTQRSGVPNHATWTLGHVIFGCQEMAAEIGTERWLPEDWESVFGYGSTPLPEGHRYPKKTEMQTLLAEAAARLSQALRGADPSTLSLPLDDDDFPTMGAVLLQVIVAHTAYHAGQLGMWRRAMGKEPVEVFI